MRKSEQGQILSLPEHLKPSQKLSTEIYDSVYGKITIAEETAPLAESAGIMIKYGYTLNHFEPQPGKFLGIWPYDRSGSNLISLRTKWGYSGIWAADTAQYNDALRAGYSKRNIMLDISFPEGNPGEFQDKVLNYDAGYYYLGEAVNHACFGNGDRRLYHWTELLTVSSFIHANRPSSFFTSDGYKRCEHLDSLASAADVIMYSAYSHWAQANLILNCNHNMNWGESEDMWFEGSDDQRSTWSEMKDRYGEKFSQTWINSYEIDEYSLLFSHAVNLGINRIWIYGYMKDGEPVLHYNNYEGISYNAFLNGFLRMFARKLEIYWECTAADPGECNPDDLNNNWHVFRILPIEVIELFP